jgi:integrase
MADADKPDHMDFTYMGRKVKQIMRAAGLREELPFTSFRHGGFTEMGDAELSDRQIMAQGRHRSTKVLPRYVKRTMRQVAKGAQKRRAVREPQVEE